MNQLRKTLIAVAASVFAVALIVFGVYVLRNSPAFLDFAPGNENPAETAAETSAEPAAAPTAPSLTPAPVSQAEPEPEEEPELPVSVVAPSAIGDMTITAMSVAAEGISADSEFVIAPNFKTDAAELLDLLSFNNAGNGVPFTIAETKSDEFLLIPNEQLQKNSIYTIQYAPPDKRTLSFAFQTEPGFGVVKSLPADSGYGVPVDTSIEITFSAPLKTDISDYFSIRPAVRGNWTQAGATYIFVPEYLNFSAVYDVTVRGGKTGVVSVDGETLDADFEFTFSTQWSGERYAFCKLSGEIYETFIPDDDVFIEILASREYAEAVYAVSVYSVPDARSFADGEADYLKSETLPPGYELIETMNTLLYEAEFGSYHYSYYILTGKTYAPGYYLFTAEAEYEGLKASVRKWIQVSALSVYAFSADGQLVVWVNDALTSRPVKGARVAADGNDAVTDDGGIAVLDVSVNDGAKVFIEANGYKTFVYTIETFDAKPLPADERYYAYFYTDRSSYFPRDRIRVFGAINARFAEYAIDAYDDVCLKLGDMLEVVIKPDKYGCFDAEIFIDGMYGGARMNLCVNGAVIYTRYLTFKEYERDKYILSGTTDRRAYFMGEHIGVNIHATTMDGSPAGGIAAVSDAYAFEPVDGSERIVTDKTGAAAGGYVGNSYSTDGSNWAPYTRSLYFSMLGAEEYLQSLSVPVVLLPSEVMLEYKIPDDGSVEFFASYIDRDALETYLEKPENRRYEWYYDYDPDIYRGRPANTNFSFTVYKETVVREKVREYYDFINKRNVPVYDYNIETEVVSEYDLVAANGRVRLNGLPVSDDIFVKYYGVAVFTDPGGRLVKTDVSLGLNRAAYNYYDTRRYYFKIDERPETPDAGDMYSLRAGETGYVRLTASDLPADEIITSGKILMVNTANGVKGAWTGSPAGTSFKFEKEYIYNAVVFGAYFDGRRVYQIEYPMYISYDYTEADLKFDVVFDRETYEPGGLVKAEIAVTDAYGLPVKAAVNVCVVDEAVLRKNPNDASFLRNYYWKAYNYTYPYAVYTSFIRHGMDFGGAEKGDGGDYEEFNLRRDFDDNPAFITTETDADGRVDISFVLSDAVTEWRVTLHGMTRDSQAGDDKRNITATLPFYIDVVMVDTFLTGDHLAALVKPHGSAYAQANTEVVYSGQLIKDGRVMAEKEIIGKGFTAFNFGGRPAGEYMVRVYAETDIGGEIYRDAAEEALSVVESDIRLPFNVRRTLNEENPALAYGRDITVSPVNVSFMNADFGPLMDILNSCTDYASRRTDVMAANAYASAFWDDGGDLKVTLAPGGAPGLSAALINTDGVGELEYGEPDLLYTARFAAAFPEFVSKARVRAFVERTAGLYADGVPAPASPDASVEINRAAGYFALAAIGDGVLIDVYDQIRIIRSDADQARYAAYEGRLRVLLYAAALVSLGDDAAAARFMEEYPLTDEAYAHADAAEEGTRRETLNALLLFVETATDPQKAFDGLKNRETQNIYVSDVCERINFLRTITTAPEIRSEIQYDLDGKTETAELKNYEGLRLVLSAVQFDRLNARRVNGDTDAYISFTGTPDDLDETLNALTFTKEVTPVEGSNGLFRVLYTLYADEGDISAARSYTIYDRVPGNMRFTALGRSALKGGYWVNAERQRVSAWVMTDGKSPSYEIEYFMQQINDAYAVPTDAYIVKSGSGGLWGRSE